MVDLADDSGRFATKMLAELGASVVRVHDGDGITHGPAMRAVDGGLLDWWYDAGKRSLPLRLETPEGADAYRSLAARADLVVETQAPGRLGALGLDHADLLDANPKLVQVSLTPFGRTGPRASWATTDLVAAGLAGVLSISGTPEHAVVPWGRQAYASASMVAALCGLAGVRAARRDGRGQLIDVSLHEALTSSIEQIWFQYHYDDTLPYPKVAPRQGSLHWSRAYQVVPCASGWLMVTPTPGAPNLIAWLRERDVPGSEQFAEPGFLLGPEHYYPLMRCGADLAAQGNAHELFHEAQGRHIAWGEVLTVADLVGNVQLAHRGAFVSTPDVPAVRRPRYPAVFSGTGVEPPRAPATAALDDSLAEWPELSTPASARAAAADAARPLDGVRVLDLSWVLAGPFGCRLLGDLGADVIKLQTAERATSVNDPAHGFYPTFNRSKRSVALDMKAPGALDIMRRLVERADVLIENYAAGVLARWGLDWDTLRAWNPRLVYVSMSGCGHDGPWRSMISYAPTIHALCGLTALTNPAGRGDVGVGYALNDMSVGGIAAVSILAALEARERTGEGQLVDVAQLEVGSYLVGAALVDLLANGREAVATGNADPYADFVVNEVFPTSDGEVAVTVRSDADVVSLRTVTGGGVDDLASWCASRSAEQAAAALQLAGIPAGRVQNAHHLFTDDEQLAARSFFATYESPNFGERAFERFPARWSDSVLEPYRRAPAYVGEHAFEVLGEVVGMSDDEIADAMADGRLA